MITISWILGIVSVLGIGGAVLAFFFIPTVAVPIMQAFVASVLKCKPCLYAIAGIALGMALFWGGYHQAKVSDRSAELAAQLAAQQADIDNANQAKKDATDRASKIEADANAQHQKDIEYIASLQKKPSCSLDGNDVGGLRNRAVQHIKKLAPLPR